MGTQGGRPAHYESPEELESRINEYFDYIRGEWHNEDTIDEDGKPAKIRVWHRPPEPATITGMCLYLGFESRQSFHDYANREKFSYTIKKARLRIEAEYEKSAQLAKVPTFHIFALKNLGWSDKQEIDHTSGGEKIEPTRIVFGKPGGD